MALLVRQRPSLRPVGYFVPCISRSAFPPDGAQLSRYRGGLPPRPSQFTAPSESGDVVRQPTAIHPPNCTLRSISTLSQLPQIQVLTFQRKKPRVRFPESVWNPSRVENQLLSRLTTPPHSEYLLATLVGCPRPWLCFLPTDFQATGFRTTSG